MPTDPPALVLLHGFAGGPESFEGLRARLPPGRPSYAPALPGHAGEPPPTDGFEAAADSLVARTSRLSDGPAHLVGYSMGGRLALGIAVRRPASVARLTLIGVHHGLGDDDARRQRVEEDSAWVRLIEEDMERFVRAWEERPLFSTQRRLDERRLSAQRATRLRHEPRSLAQALRVLGLGNMPDYSLTLASIGAPVDLVVGEQDQKFRAIAERMARRLPRSRLLVVPTCGHNVVLERPEALAAIISAPFSKS